MAARPEPVHVDEDEGVVEASPRWVHELSQVRAAILMVEGGPYPRITVTNLVEGAAIAEELRPEAATRGVELVSADGPDGPIHVMRLRRA